MRNNNTDPTPCPSPTREGRESEGRGDSRLFSAVLPYKGGERVGRKGKELAFLCGSPLLGRGESEEGERVGFSLRFSPPL